MGQDNGPQAGLNSTPDGSRNRRTAPQLGKIEANRTGDPLAVTDILIAFLRKWGELDLPGIAVLAVVFVVSGLIPVPRTALCLASGTVFGIGAIPVILPSTTIGGVVGFLSARYLFAQRLQRMVDRKPKLRAVLNAIDSESWRIVGLMRFAGPLPTFAQNYLFGLTRIGLAPFTWATFVFTIPQVCLYVYLGALGRAALLEDGRSHLSLALGFIAALTLLSVLIVITRKARAALQERSA